MRKLILCLAGFLWASSALAQSPPNPPFYYGYVPTAATWNAIFASKQDYLGFTPLNPSSVVASAPITTSFGGGVLTIGINVGSGGLSVGAGALNLTGAASTLKCNSTGSLGNAQDCTLGVGLNFLTAGKLQVAPASVRMAPKSTQATTPADAWDVVDPYGNSIVIGASITATISTTTLTVTSVASGTLSLGQTIAGSGVTSGSKITAFGSGTGGAGTYTLSASSTVASPETMTATTNTQGLQEALDAVQTNNWGLLCYGPGTASAGQPATVHIASGLVIAPKHETFIKAYNCDVTSTGTLGSSPLWTIRSQENGHIDWNGLTSENPSDTGPVFAIAPLTGDGAVSFADTYIHFVGTAPSAGSVGVKLDSSSKAFAGNQFYFEDIGGGALAIQCAGTNNFYGNWFYGLDWHTQTSGTTQCTSGIGASQQNHWVVNISRPTGVITTAWDMLSVGDELKTYVSSELSATITNAVKWGINACSNSAEITVNNATNFVVDTSNCNFSRYNTTNAFASMTLMLNGSAMATAANALTWTNKTFDTAGAGNVLKINGTSVTALSGNTATLATTSGALTVNHAAKFDASGNIVDGGAIGGLTVGSTAVASGTTNQLLYDNGGTLGEVTKCNTGAYITNGTGVPSCGAVPNANLANSSVTLNAGTNFGMTTPGATSLGATGVFGTTTDNLRFADLGLGVAAPTSGGQIAQTLGANNITGHVIKRNTDTSPTGSFLDLQNAAGGSLLTIDITGSVSTDLNIVSGKGITIAGAAASGNVLRGNGTRFTAAALACGDLSNGATGCSTATGTSGATIPLLNAANAWSGVQTFGSADALFTPGNAAAGNELTPVLTRCKQVTPTGNGADTTADTLQSCILKANSFNANGSYVDIQAEGTFGGNGNNKVITVTFGGTTVYNTGTLTLNGASWAVQMRVWRTGSSAQRFGGLGMIAAGSPIGPSGGNGTAAENDAADITIAIKGQSPTTGAANDVVANSMFVKYGN